jgi:hypothetical protein
MTLYKEFQVTRIWTVTGIIMSYFFQVFSLYNKNMILNMLVRSGNQAETFYWVQYHGLFQLAIKLVGSSSRVC